jgi:two-component system chemotaxis response regulator CheB
MSNRLIVIGASVGGAKALCTILKAFPQHFPVPIAIVLHRGVSTASLSDYLQKHCALTVLEAQDKIRIQPGFVYVAPCNYHLIVDKDYFSLSLDKPVHFARPSIDVLYESAADSFGTQVIGVLLTGSGSDGAEGLLLIKQSGGYTIVEDPSTAENKTLPEAALKLGSASQVLPLDEIAKHLILLCQASAPLRDV